MGGVVVVLGVVAGVVFWPDATVALDGPPRFVDLTAAGEHGCLRHGSGRVACFGSGARAAREPVNRAFGVVPQPDDDVAKWVLGAERAVQVEPGSAHACLRRDDGAVYCWGFRPLPSGLDEINASSSEAPVLEHPRLVFDGARLLAQTEEDNAILLSTHDEAIAVGASPTVTWALLPTSLRRFASSVSLLSMRTVSADMTDFVWAGQHRCWRWKTGRAECESKGITGPDGRPIASLEAPTGRVRAIGVSTSQTCFVLEDGAVDCRSSDGVLTPEFPFQAESAEADMRQVCALHAGTVTCRSYRFDLEHAGALQLGPMVDVIHGVRVIAAMSERVCALHGDSDDRVSCWSDNESPLAIELPH